MAITLRDIDRVLRPANRRWARNEIKRIERSHELFRRLFRPLLDAYGRPAGTVKVTGTPIQMNVIYRPR